MENLEKKVLEAAKGGQRLKPDEQKRFLGTFAERVILVVQQAEAECPALKKAFPNILADFQTSYQQLHLKISPKLALADQMLYLKMAQDLGLAATIIDEAKVNSPFALLLHTDRAVHLAQIDVQQVFPQLFKQEDVPSQKKQSFWSRLFKYSRMK